MQIRSSGMAVNLYTSNGYGKTIFAPHEDKTRTVRYPFQNSTSLDSPPVSTYKHKSKSNGEGGIRTRGTGVYPYDGLANRCLKPLGHLSEQSYNNLHPAGQHCKQITCKLTLFDNDPAKPHERSQITVRTASQYPWQQSGQ